MVGCGSIGQTVLPLLLRDHGVPARPHHRADGRRARRRHRRWARRPLPGGTVDARESSCGAGRPDRTRRLPAQPLGRGREPGAAAVRVRVAARSISTPASSRGPVAIPTPASRRPSVPTRRFARVRWPCGGPSALACRRPSSARAPTPAWSHSWSRPPGSTSLGCWAWSRVAPAAADGWARLFRDLGIRTIHIAEHDSQVSRTPTGGRRVRRHLVGRRVSRRGCAAGRAGLGHRRGDPSGGRPPARRARARASTCCARASTCACAAGPRPPVRSSATWSPTWNRSRSPIT